MAHEAHVVPSLDHRTRKPEDGPLCPGEQLEAREHEIETQDGHAAGWIGVAVIIGQALGARVGRSQTRTA